MRIAALLKTPNYTVNKVKKSIGHYIFACFKSPSVGIEDFADFKCFSVICAMPCYRNCWQLNLLHIFFRESLILNQIVNNHVIMQSNLKTTIEKSYILLNKLKLLSVISKLTMIVFSYIPVPLVVASDGNKFYPEMLTINEIYFDKPYDKFFAPQKNWVIVDVGANFGIYALRASKMVGENGQVIAIEPEPLNFKILKQHVRINKIRNMLLVNLAMGDKVGTVKLFLNGNGFNSIKQQNSGKYVKVPLTTLDHTLDALKIKHIDLLKIDVEGAELDVLKGLRKLPKHIVIEYHGAENAKKVSNMLKSLKYTVIIPTGQTEDLGYLYGLLV